MECFDLALVGGDRPVAHLTLNRPAQLNTLGPVFWRELEDTLRTLHREGRARALVVSSTGKHFTAGMELSVFDGAISFNEQTATGRATIADSLGDIQATFTMMETLRIPVICAIQGGCIGGGVDFVTCADIRYASADAFFCIQEINIGMVADVGTLQRLPKLVPLGVVKELAYTGRRMGAARAREVGLVNEVFASHEATVAAALQCATEIAAKPPIAIWGSKQAINYARDHSVADGLQQMGWLQAGIWDTGAVTEAVTAMKEKRAGRFAPLAPIRSFTHP
jgi:enoyl-CoA hydratase